VTVVRYREAVEEPFAGVAEEGEVRILSAALGLENQLPPKRPYFPEMEGSLALSHDSADPGGVGRPETTPAGDSIIAP